MTNGEFKIQSVMLFLFRLDRCILTIQKLMKEEESVLAVPELNGRP